MHSTEGTSNPLESASTAVSHVYFASLEQRDLLPAHRVIAISIADLFGTHADVLELSAQI